jgi:hypothetical protein
MGLLDLLHLRGRRRDTRRPFSQKPAKPGAPLVLGGRTFRPIGESTVEHDYLFIGLVRELGLDDPRLLPSETPEQFAMRLLTDVIASGRALDALGYLLTPVDVESEEWTPEIGSETVEFIGKLVDPADKALIRGLTLGFLSDFFERGLGSWALSTASSGEPTAAKSASPSMIPATATGSGAP